MLLSCPPWLLVLSRSAMPLLTVRLLQSEQKIVLCIKRISLENDKSCRLSKVVTCFQATFCLDFGSQKVIAQIHFWSDVSLSIFADVCTLADVVITNLLCRDIIRIGVAQTRIVVTLGAMAKEKKWQ